MILLHYILALESTNKDISVVKTISHSHFDQAQMDVGRNLASHRFQCRVFDYIFAQRLRYAVGHGLTGFHFVTSLDDVLYEIVVVFITTRVKVAEMSQHDALAFVCCLLSVVVL